MRQPGSRTRRSMSWMATNRADQFADEPEDPIHEEVRLMMADPELRARLRAANERIERGDLPPRVSSNEVRRMIGVPPVPGQD